MSMFSQFKTNPDLEKNGVVIDYGTFRVTIARAGGANKKFGRLLEAKTKPHKRAIQTETMDQEKSVDIMREVYADAVILNWETKINDQFVVGIEDPEDASKTVPFTRDNLLATFKALPDLFSDLQEQAMRAALFRDELREEDAKN